LTTADYSTVEAYAYQYDPVGNRTTYTLTAPLDGTAVTTYTYDAANRFLVVGAPGHSVAYTPDLRRCIVSERGLRLVLAGAMFVSFCLPWWPTRSVSFAASGWFLVFWATSSSLSIVLAGTDFANFIGHLRFLADLWSTLFLLALNFWIAVQPSRQLKVFYRGALLVTTILKLSMIPFISVSETGWGFWVCELSIFVAVLVEVFLIIRERRLSLP